MIWPECQQHGARGRSAVFSKLLASVPPSRGLQEWSELLHPPVVAERLPCQPAIFARSARTPLTAQIAQSVNSRLYIPRSLGRTAAAGARCLLMGPQVQEVVVEVVSPLTTLAQVQELAVEVEVAL